MKPFAIISLLSACSTTAAALTSQFPINPIEHLNPAPLALDGIPLLGFGTWNLDKSNASEAVSYAIQTGYRHIDCAAIYGNEHEVGVGIAQGLLKSGLKREQLWITSKLWNDHHHVDDVEAAIHSTLGNLGLEYLDLYHMHWPVSHDIAGRNHIDYVDTWTAMMRLVTLGKTRHIGVANFAPQELHRLINETSYLPSVHQMELHPYLQQQDFVDWHKKKGIHVTAYSPLGGTNPTYQPGDLTPLLENKRVQHIAKNRGCTPAQVVLQWGLGRGTSVIPKSQHANRIEDNYASSSCPLKMSDLKRLQSLSKKYHRYNNPSKSWGVELFQGLEDSKGKHTAQA